MTGCTICPVGSWKKAGQKMSNRNLKPGRWLKKYTYFHIYDMLLLFLCYAIILAMGSENRDMLAGRDRLGAVFDGIRNEEQGFRLFDYIQWLLPVFLFLYIMGKSVIHDIFMDSAFKITRYKSMAEWHDSVWSRALATGCIYAIVVGVFLSFYMIMSTSLSPGKVVIGIGFYFLYLIFVNMFQVLLLLYVKKGELVFLILFAGILFSNVLGFFVPAVDKICFFNWGMLVRGDYVTPGGYSSRIVGLIMLFFVCLGGRIGLKNK